MVADRLYDAGDGADAMGWTPTMLALAESVRASPEDAEQWKVFAECLMDAGDVRGELIAKWQRLADSGLPAEPRRALRAEVEATEAAHQQAWLAGLSLPKRARMEWRCGFVVKVWLPFNDELFDVLAHLCAHPSGRLLATLDLGFTDITDEGAATIARCTTLCGLHLSYNGIGDKGAATLAACTSLRNLRVLDLDTSNIGFDRAASIAASTTLSRLTALNLDNNNDLGDKGSAAIAASATLSRLTALHLRTNDIGSEGASVQRRCRA